MMRLLNVLVIVSLIFAAAFVYKIKFDSTLQIERVAKLHGQIRRERDAIATLRAEWSRLDNPARIQALAERHLTLKPVSPTQFDTFDNLPPRPPDAVPPVDPIAAILNASKREFTGSIAPAARR
ncbi:MAG TPA: hypothetical protein VFL51_08285 [Pseudolabrys sp.]|nr:hypothetical protein [Pseudolabrys sp.]